MLKSSTILSSFLFVFFLTGCKKEKEVKYSSDLIDVLGPKGKPVFDTLNIPQNLIKVVAEISEVNTYETGVLAKGQEVSTNFENFEKLKKLATEKDLVNLTRNKNLVVALYAANALAEKKYVHIDEVFNRLINSNAKVYTQNGCIVGDLNISIPFYTKYLFSLEKTEVPMDINLKKFDRMILYNDNSDDELINYALQNRVYATNYRSRIEYLAFKKKNESAVFYLSNWHKAVYSNRLQKEFKDLLSQDSLRPQVYYQYVKELLDFKNPQNNSFIISKLKKDTIWKDYGDNGVEVKWLLDRNGIYLDEN